MTEDVPITCPDPRCEEIAALSTVAALGGELEQEEALCLVTYLVACSRCRRRLDAYVSVARRLPLSVPDAEPPSALRERVILAVQQGAKVPQRPARRRLGLPWPRLAAPLLALLAALLLVWNLSLQRQFQLQQEQSTRYRAMLLAIFGDDDAEEGVLQATQQAPAASGRIWYAPGRGALGVYVKNLPALPPGSVYQLWLNDNGRRVSGGTFRVDQQGRGWLLIQTDIPLNTIEGLGITAEPEGGSTGPTGPKYLDGSL